MERNINQEKIDELITYFWKNGFLTVKRKFGTFLPPPEHIGNYEIDALGKCVQKFAIGITLSDSDLKDKKLIEKLIFLATRHSKFSKQNVVLFVGVPKNSLTDAKAILLNIDEKIRKNIKLVPITTSSYVN